MRRNKERRWLIERKGRKRKETKKQGVRDGMRREGGELKGKERKEEKKS